MPISSVTAADARVSSRTIASTAGPLPPWRWSASSRRRNGRTARNISPTYAAASPAVTSPGTNPSARPMATTNASMHQAVTSSTAAQVMATAPTLVLCSCRSVRMRASTGKAVTLMDAPMNRATGVKAICGASLKTSG